MVYSTKKSKSEEFTIYKFTLETEPSTFKNQNSMSDLVVNEREGKER